MRRCRLWWRWWLFHRCRRFNFALRSAIVLACKGVLVIIYKVEFEEVSICTIPSLTFCVTVNVLPVSKGTVQLTGSGERIIICSGDLTLVGSGGDFTNGSSGTSGTGCGLQLEMEIAVSRPSSVSSVGVLKIIKNKYYNFYLTRFLISCFNIIRCVLCVYFYLLFWCCCSCWISVFLSIFNFFEANFVIEILLVSSWNLKSK